MSIFNLTSFPSSFHMLLVYVYSSCVYTDYRYYLLKDRKCYKLLLNYLNVTLGTINVYN